MDDKEQILAMLKEVFDCWEELLASLSEEQVTAPYLPANWSVKDVIAHLWAWQQISVVRAEAALQDREPEYPRWSDPEEENVDRTNAWIYETYRDKPWSDIYADWKAQFLRYLGLTKEIPEKDLLEHGRYAWMGKYALSASLLGSYDHHQEHIEKLLAWIRERGNMKPG